MAAIVPESGNNPVEEALIGGASVLILAHVYKGLMGLPWGLITGVTSGLAVGLLTNNFSEGLLVGGITGVSTLTGKAIYATIQGIGAHRRHKETHGRIRTSLSSLPPTLRH